MGVLLSAPMHTVRGTDIPVGKDVFGAFPRALAAVGSGIGATVILVGAIGSAIRYLRHRTTPGSGRMAGANAVIALGTLVLSSGGLVQGIVGHDEAFSLSLAFGISVIYGGFLLADGRRPALGDDPASGDQSGRSSRRTSLPARLRGSSSTTS